MPLFSERSLWTMIHGIGLGGVSLLALSAVLFAMYMMRRREGESTGADDASGPVALLASFAALMLWLTTLVGTYIVFPLYRAAAPDGSTDLSRYPRSMLLADPATAWLHAFAMETKEHLPFVAAMLVTAVASVAWSYRRRLLDDQRLHRLALALLGIGFGIVAYVSLLGVFINKVAPVE